MRAGGRSIRVGVALSGLAHVFAILMAPAAVPTPAAHVQSLVELSLEAHGSRKPESRIEAEPPAASETATSRKQPPARRAKIAGSGPLPKPHPAQEVAVPPVPADRAQEAAAPPVPTSASAAKPLDLKLRASSVATNACGTLAHRETEACGGPSAVSAVGEAEGALNESLRGAVNRPSYRNQREPPKLLPAADGGYDYTGRASEGTMLIFRAHIAVDGAVRFDDGPNLQLAPIPISGTFDINGALQRGERHAGEKRWFLEQTAELRSRLADDARALEDRHARRMVENALERIRARATTPKVKREAVIELWLGCDATSELRAIVEAWVCEHMPQGSELGFAVEELAKLNRGQSGASRFDPYGTALFSQ